MTISVKKSERRIWLPPAVFRKLISDVFEKSINMSPNEYVNLVRIQKACDLICFSMTHGNSCDKDRV